MYIFCLQYFKIVGYNIRGNAVNHVYSCLLTLVIKRVYVCLAKFGTRSCGGSLITSVIPVTVFARRPCCRYCGSGGGRGISSSGAFYKNITWKKVAYIPQTLLTGSVTPAFQICDPLHDIITVLGE
jgi:hypothetical protein